MIARTFSTTTLLFALAGPALAQDPLDNALSHRVLSGWTEADGSHMAALELTLAPGWKTYWRSPGDAGIPPQFDWRGARNVSNVHVHWPAPSVFWQSGMRSVGYSERVILPLSVAAKRSDRDIHLKGTMVLGICADICIPASISIDAVLPAGADTRTPGIVAALASLPFSAEEAGLKDARCRLAPIEDGMSLEATLRLPSTGGAEEAVVEPPTPGVWVSDAKTHRNGETLTVRADMISVSDTPMVINRSDIRITVIGGSYAVDIQGCTG